ncbi:unnamed protein product [Orchesella dallaii]|uniref:Uncharacterized protein n=1 Tax=Orchesella dallaii TaxID=48710 RepID=A0ABP1QWG0_9HEXA
MKRWKSSVLLVLCLGGLLLGCVALFLHGERLNNLENGGDLPLHPYSSPSYTSSSVNSGAVSNHPIHNSHRTDALRGVFKAHFKNASNTTTPPLQDSKEQELNSSRLKRQLDFGSDEDEAKKSGSSTPSSEEGINTNINPTNHPTLRVIQIGTKIPLPSSSFSPSSSSPEKSANNPGPGPKFRKRLHHFKPPVKKSEEENKYEVDEAPEDRKNFTLEVVQVERKVVRKEDGHIPLFFAKSNLNSIEPRLLKVKNTPSVVYKKGSSSSSSTERPKYYGKWRSTSTEGSSEESPISASNEDRSRDNSDERQVVINLDQQIPLDDQGISEEDLKDYHDGHSTFGTKGNFTHSVISRNVAGFIPNNPQQGGNNANALSKRNQQIESSPSSRRGGGRKIVIEKGRVTEKYPNTKSNPFQDPKSDIYAVPGGRSGSEEEEEDVPQQQVFKFTRNKNGKDGGNHPKNDLTSPAIPTSLEELYRKGHPGVLPAPRKKDRLLPLPHSEPYGESEEFQHPFRANPLLDDPPLKFDPESDRFYGEPIPDNKEKLAQSNSPIRVENRRSTDRQNDGKIEYQPQSLFRPAKIGRPANSQEDDDSSSVESPVKNAEPFLSSRELPARSPGSFNYGRAYNPPEYNNDYDAEQEQPEQGDNPNSNDSGFDFVGLEENDNFGGEGAPAEDYFDYGGGFGGGSSSFKPRAGNRNREGEESNEERGRGGGRSNEDDDRETTPRAGNNAPKAPSRASNEDVEYDSNGRESDYGFGPAGTEDGEAAHDTYDTGFINTLKQFDEEIKKLQNQERSKLLKPTPLPQQQEEASLPQSPVAAPNPGSSDEYKDEPPLIISSPGPLPQSDTGASPEVATTLRVTDDDEPEENIPPGTTEGLSEEVGDPTQPNVNPDEEDYQTERSKEYDDDDDTTNQSTEQSTQSSNESRYEPLKRK